MAVTVEPLLRDASVQLQDEDHVRWPLPELLEYLNNGLQEMLWLQPMAYREWRILSLEEGPRQVVEDAHQVLSLTTNVKSGDYPQGVERGRATRRVSLERLNFYNPEWHSEKAKSAVSEYMLDSVDRQSFWVYPPNDGTGQVEAKLIATPQRLQSPASPDKLDSYKSLEAKIESLYAPALVYYILARAWAKDTDFAGNLELSTHYYTRFKQVLTTGAGTGGESE